MFWCVSPMCVLLKQIVVFPNEQKRNRGSISDPCPPGSFINLLTAQCEMCPAGYYQDKHNEVSCTTCGFGFYQNETGQSSCVPCPHGRTTVTTVATSVALCFGNKFSWIFFVQGQLCCLSFHFGSLQFHLWTNLWKKCPQQNDVLRKSNHPGRSSLKCPHPS